MQKWTCHVTVLTIILCHYRRRHPPIIIIGVINARRVVVVLSIKYGEEAGFPGGIFVPNYTQSPVPTRDY